MIILPVLFGLLLLLLCSGLYMFVNACLRRKELPWFEKEELAKTPYGRYYETILDADQWLRDNEARDIWIQSYDGLKLHGHWVAAKNPVGTVLLVHGYRSTKLVDFGVAQTRIIMEDKSTSTNENLMYSKQLIPDGASVVIVTSRFHVYRACHLARECGYTSVSGLGAENVRWLNPTNYLRECMAVFKDVVLK